jgi:hypothetical protein
MKAMLYLAFRYRNIDDYCSQLSIEKRPDRSGLIHS